MPVFRLGEELVFPPVELAEEGLLAVGGDLSPERLELAYSLGIFPWYSEGEPILWHSPDPRFVLTPESLHVPRDGGLILALGFHFGALVDTLVGRRATADNSQNQQGTGHYLDRTHGKPAQFGVKRYPSNRQEWC